MGGRGSRSGVAGFIDWLANEGGGAGGGSGYPIDIDNLGLHTLQDVENRIRNLKHEELYVFDKDGNLIEAYKGNKTSVAFPSDVLQYEGATVTHGHPKGAAQFGGTLSFADMKNMLKSQWSEHRATASGQGEMNYILRRGRKSDSVGFYKQINKDYQRLTGSLKDTYNNAYQKALDAGKTRATAMHEARQTAVGELNRYYKDTAPKFGFEYITRKKAYKYNR